MTSSNFPIQHVNGQSRFRIFTDIMEAHSQPFCVRSLAFALTEPICTHNDKEKSVVKTFCGIKAKPLITRAANLNTVELCKSAFDMLRRFPLD